MEKVRAHFRDRRDDLLSRYRPAKSPEEWQKVRDMQKFNMEARKYRGVIPLITATSPRQTTLRKAESPFIAFGGILQNCLWYQEIIGKS
jgi:hypothetical protein